jgi:hypothetical protein
LISNASKIESSYFSANTSIPILSLNLSIAIQV